MFVHGQQRKPGVVGLSYGSAGPVLVDVTNAEIFIITPDIGLIYGHFLTPFY